MKISAALAGLSFAFAASFATILPQPRACPIWPAAKWLW